MVVIATPTRDSITAGCTADLIRLCRRYPDARFLSPLGIYISLLRESSVLAAQQLGASHILFVDADMRFPEDGLDQLLMRDVEIVGANYAQRMPPHWSTAWDADGPVPASGRTGLHAVHSLGFGFVLINLSVFDRLERPWFDTPYDGKTYVGEDVNFCRKARAAGMLVLVDHDLSQAVRHQGSIELGARTVLDRRAEDARAGSLDASSPHGIRPHEVLANVK